MFHAYLLFRQPNIDSFCPCGYTMATAGQTGALTEKQISDLVKILSTKTLERVVLFHLGMTNNTLVKLNNANRGEPEALRREIFQHWASENAGPGQQQMSKAFVFIALMQKASYMSATIYLDQQIGGFNDFSQYTRPNSNVLL